MRSVWLYCMRLTNLEWKLRDDMTEEEAIALVAKAIRSGIFNDLGSGSNVDLCVISEGGKKVDYKRNHEFLQAKTYSRQQPVVFEKGTARKSHQNLLPPSCTYHDMSPTCTLMALLCLSSHADGKLGCAAAVSGERIHKIIPLDALHIIEGEPADAVGMDIE